MWPILLCAYLLKIDKSWALFLSRSATFGFRAASHGIPFPKKLPDEPPSSQETGGWGEKGGRGGGEVETETERKRKLSLFLPNCPRVTLLIPPLCNQVRCLITGSLLSSPRRKPWKGHERPRLTGASQTGPINRVFLCSDSPHCSLQLIYGVRLADVLGQVGDGLFRRWKR